MLGFTHAIFALSLGYILELPIVFLMLGSLFPDLDLILDFGFPFVHRGIVHSLLAALVFSLLLFLITMRKSSSLAFFLGYISHLFLDTFTPVGIMWLYPLETFYSMKIFLSGSLFGNLFISIVSIISLLIWMNRYKINLRGLKWAKS